MADSCELADLDGFELRMVQDRFNQRRWPTQDGAVVKWFGGQHPLVIRREGQRRPLALGPVDGSSPLRLRKELRIGFEQVVVAVAATEFKLFCLKYLRAEGRLLGFGERLLVNALVFFFA